jgi:cell division septation protein DedD
MNNLALSRATSAAVIPFSDNLPDYIVRAPSDLAELTAGMGGGFPVLSIKGKTFTVVRDGKRQIVTRPDDDEAPANYVELVFIRSNPAMSKVFYLKGYEEGSTQRPDCSSNDGVKPDAGVPSPQAKNCATCPHNAFGSGATGKGKACQDTRRIAVAALTNLDDPLLLRVPPGSFKNLVKYAQWLAQRNVKSYSAVLTRVKFDPAEATPKLIFEPRGLLAEETLELVQEIAQSDLVQQIVGLVPLERDEDEELRLDLPKVSHQDPVPAQAVKDEAPAPKKTRATKSTPRPEPKPEPKPEPQPEPKPEPKKAKGFVVDDLDSLNAALDDLLGEYDG